MRAANWSLIFYKEEEKRKNELNHLSQDHCNSDLILCAELLYQKQLFWNLPSNRGAVLQVLCLFNCAVDLWLLGVLIFFTIRMHLNFWHIAILIAKIAICLRFNYTSIVLLKLNSRRQIRIIAYSSLFSFRLVLSLSWCYSKMMHIFTRFLNLFSLLSKLNSSHSCFYITIFRKIIHG